MNIKRIVAITLVVLLVATMFAGVASAFSVTQPATSNPSGSLVPGQEVVSTMKVKYNSGEMGVGKRLNLATDLVGASWTVEIMKGNVIVSTLNPTPDYCYVDGFSLDYDVDSGVVAHITVKGIVSSTSAGTEISTIKLSEYGTSSQSTYASPKQFVYDTGNLDGSLSSLNTAIQTTDARITDYSTNFGSDCSAAKGKVELARSKYLSAQTAASNDDDVTAFKNIEDGMKYISQAETDLASIALGLIASYTQAVDSDIYFLYGKGWNQEAVLLDTKNTGYKNTYTQYYNSYMSGNTPSAVELDSLRNQCYNLYTESQQYVNDANNPLGGVVKYLPFILIGVGVIVVGILIFFLIRKRKNSWDELG